MPNALPLPYPGTLFALLLALSGWALVLWGTLHPMHPLVMLSMPDSAAWTALQLFMVWLMWAVMMVAMMLPSALPMIAVYDRVIQGRSRPRHWSLIFVVSYLLIWSGFSLLAAGLQWLLQSAQVLSRMLVLQHDGLVAAILLLAGLAQWLPVKQRCLEQCRTPFGFITHEWRSGAVGALQMGLRHGLYCLGCCWLIMLVLFTFGVMNLPLILALTLLVALEKLLPERVPGSTILGVLLIGASFVVLATQYHSPWSAG